MLARWEQPNAWMMMVMTILETIIVMLVGVYGTGFNQQQVVITEAANSSDAQLGNGGDYAYQYETKWPILDWALGSVSAVALDIKGNVVIFHRGSHVWNLQSFDKDNRYTQVDQGPIAESTLLTFNSESGALISEWGANYFFMPHGLTIDRNNTYWLTDVALHQVFKFVLNISTEMPVLTLGHRFQPGNGLSSFCKPTAVAVLENGDFFVSDGYCNGRVMKFSPDGKLILSWGKNSFVLTRTYVLPSGSPVPENFFAIPHALTYAADKGQLCVADREQGRIQCFDANNGTFLSMYSDPQIGSRIFSVKYIPLDGGLLYIINGPQFTTAEPVNGFILSMTTRRIVGRLFPVSSQKAFSNPHEIAVSASGEQVYVAELSPTKVHKFTRIGGPAGPTYTTVLQPKQRPMPVAVDSSVAADALYASTLIVISIVVSLIGTGCLIICVFRTACTKPGQARRERFSSPSENISLRSLNRDDEELGL